ncbi:MAG: hypothetical protein WED09_07735 [Homoserinimonas sp.]
MRESLSAEPLYLASTLAELLDDEPEAFELAALIAQGESWRRRAHALGRIGRFQLEAAIQSVHCARAISSLTDWMALRKLYEALVSIAPSLESRVSLAAIIGRVEGALAGLESLDGITDVAVGRFQPA